MRNLLERTDDADRGADSASSLTRRAMLTASAAAGGGLVLTVALPLPRAIQAAAAAPGGAADFAPNAFVRIGRSGPVQLMIPSVEMGQGVYTSLAMLLAEELEVELAQVQVEPAPANEKLYANPLFGLQVTGGSISIRGFYDPLRQAGAAARMMLVAAAAETWRVDPATCHAEKGAVLHAATGRRLDYGELADKAAKQSVPAQVALKERKAFSLIGTPAKRVDAADKVNGRAVFGIDVRVPGMKIATVASCPVFGGKLASVDDAAAKKVKGVSQVVRIDDAVAVIADHMGAARKGLAALDIKWDEGANARMSSADLVGALQRAAQKPGVVAKQEGEVEPALKAAARTVEANYEAPFLAHTTMEPINCTIHVRGDGCDVWVGNQVPARVQAAAAEATGLPLDKVAVHIQLLGGGFGRRLEIDYVTQAAKIARQVPFPVKVIWSREEDIQHDIYRPYYVDRFAAGLDGSGTVVAFHHRIASSSIVARWLPPAYKNDLDFDAVDMAAGAYAFPNALVDWVRQEPPAGLVTGWWRGVGVTHNAFVVESFMDEIAGAAGKDPVEFRRALLGKNPRARAVLDLAAAKAGWGEPMPARSGRGVALIEGFGSFMAMVADVTVDKEGQVRIDRVVSAVDCGIVVNPDTVRAQMEGGIIFGLTAALYGEITFKNGRVEQTNFDNYQALRINEAPKIEVHLVDSNDKPGGMGEPGTATIAPAVANAIFAATGKRIRKLPIDASGLKQTS
jgi:isoquinoline 1-oxidoreductase beta subunit